MSYIEGLKDQVEHQVSMAEHMIQDYLKSQKNSL